MRPLSEKTYRNNLRIWRNVLSATPIFSDMDVGMIQ